VAIYLEKPKAIGSKPVIVVSIENHRVIRGNARFAREFFEILLADNVAPDLILVVGFGIHIYFDQLDARLAEDVFNPVGRDEHLGVSVICHSR
jgi:hypothetical protein